MTNVNYDVRNTSEKVWEEKIDYIQKTSLSKFFAIQKAIQETFSALTEIVELTSLSSSLSTILCTIIQDS